MFVGRASELKKLQQIVVQTRAGRPANFLITGERGIGKSSLLNYLKFVAEGQEPMGDTSMRFLVVDTDVDPRTTQLGLIKKFELSIRRKLSRSEPARNFLKETWGFLKKFEAAGVKIHSEEKVEDTEILLEEFSFTLADIVSRLCDEENAEGWFSAKYEGILILIDEADKASKMLDIGSFLKLLTERLQRRGCERVMIGLAGLPDLPRILAESHESSLRLFEHLPLDRLEEPEINRVVDLCLTEANRMNTRVTSIDQAARDLFVTLSEGYPHFIQQFGYSAFAEDVDDHIDQVDVITGAFGKRGAMELIGDRYYRDSFYNKIQKESYRQVLRIMADRFDGWITKQEIRSKFRGKDSVLDSAILALRDRNIILSKEGERGVYRLHHKGFAWWIKLFTTHNMSTPGQGSYEPTD